MDNCEIKSEEGDFFHQFMDLEEFIDASTTGTSPGLPRSRYGSVTSPNIQPDVNSVNMVDKDHEQTTNSSSEMDNSSCENASNDSPALSPDNGSNVVKDQRYWDRRLKNNIAAKRSRDAKRQKETSVVKRWTFLEEENKRLKEQISNMQRRLNAASGAGNNLTI